MAFDGEDNSLEMIVLASATYAIFKLKGPEKLKKLFENLHIMTNGY